MTRIKTNHFTNNTLPLCRDLWVFPLTSLTTQMWCLLWRLHLLKKFFLNHSTDHAKYNSICNFSISIQYQKNRQSRKKSHHKKCWFYRINFDLVLKQLTRWIQRIQSIVSRKAYSATANRRAEKRKKDIERSAKMQKKLIRRKIVQNMQACELNIYCYSFRSFVVVALHSRFVRLSFVALYIYGHFFIG